jgi:hypothetical protein
MARPKRETGYMVLDEAALEAAVVGASERNNLLPSRPDDSVGGEVGKRFSAALSRAIKSGRYEPTRAHFVAVPKNINATRPAALLTLEDRVVYHALVEQLRARIQGGMLSSDIVMWPRGPVTEKRWNDFERFGSEGTHSHVIRCDISAFYDSIPHQQLGDILVALTGYQDVVDTLIDFLSRTMVAPKGIPQGPEASDPLATAYLSTIDQEMVRAGIDYVRHGDDIRIRCDTFSDVRRSLHELEQAVRRSGLSLSSHKTVVMRTETYARSFATVPEEIAAAQTRAKEEYLASLATGEEEDVEKALDDAGLHEVGWQLLYHHTIDIGQAIEKLRPMIKPTEVRVAETVLRDALARQPGEANALDAEVFHALVQKALISMSAGKSTAGVPHCAKLLLRFPDKTELVAEYLIAASLSDPDSVATVIQEFLQSPNYKTGWELAWCLRVLVAGNVDATALEPDIHRIASSESRQWIARTEAARILGRLGRLEPELVRRLWSLAPVVFRGDLIAAVAAMPSLTWTDAFLASAKGDRVHAVVIDHATRERLVRDQAAKEEPTKGQGKLQAVLDRLAAMQTEEREKRRRFKTK